MRKAITIVTAFATAILATGLMVASASTGEAAEGNGPQYVEVTIHVGTDYQDGEQFVRTFACPGDQIAINAGVVRIVAPTEPQPNPAAGITILTNGTFSLQPPTAVETDLTVLAGPVQSGHAWRFLGSGSLPALHFEQPGQPISNPRYAMDITAFLMCG